MDLNWKRILILSSLLIVVIPCSFIIWKMNWITASMLYGSFSYSAGGYHVGIRAIQYILAFSWIVILLIAQSLFDKPLPLITLLGQHTLPIFVLHGFIMKHPAAQNWIGCGGVLRQITACIVILLVLGNKPVYTAFNKLFFLR